MKHILLLSALLFVQVNFAQSQQNQLIVTVGANQVPTFDKNKLGFNLSARYYLSDDLSVGGQFSIANKKYNRGFVYQVHNTLLNLYTINIPIQYDVVSNDKFTLGLGLSNGIMFAVLRNPDDVEEEEVYDSETGISHIYYKPKRLNTDAYFVLTPNVDFTYKLLELDAEDNVSMLLNFNVGYQIPFGAGNFSKSSTFRNYTFNFGLSFKGLVD